MELKYGRETVSLDEDAFPSAPEVLSGTEPETVENEEEAILAAVENPVDLPPLREFLTSSDRVAVVVSDITRVTKADAILRALVRAVGVNPRRMTIIVGLGMHRPTTLEEKKRIVGEEIFERARVVDHDARAAGANVEIGFTSYGNRILVNALALKADKLIVTGTIGYHLFAGFGGGRKGIMPAIAGRRCILVNHMLPLTTREVGWNEAARPGNLDGNPAHDDMTQAAVMMDANTPIFLINTVLNSAHQLTNVFAGEIVRAFERGCEFFDRHYCIKARRKFDLVIVSCGGYPKDINFIQSHKAAEYAFPVLREGGCMIVLAECSEGLGNDAFLDWFDVESETQLELNLRRNFLTVENMNAQTAYRVCYKANRANIFFVSKLPPEWIEKMGMKPAASLDEALSRAKEILGKDFSTAVIPSGGYFRAECSV